MRTVGYPEVKDALLEWFKTPRDQNVPISGPFMAEKS